MLQDSKIRDILRGAGRPAEHAQGLDAGHFHSSRGPGRSSTPRRSSPLIQSLAGQVNIALGTELDEYGAFDVSGIQELSRERIFTDDVVAVQLVTSS